MKTKRLFLTLFMFAAMLTIFAGSTCAQDIDLSAMDNTQLMQLLQQIMQQLESEPTAESTEIVLPTATPTATPTPISVKTPDPAVNIPDDNAQLLLLIQQINDKLSANLSAEIEATPFSIYENKKLILERIPDDRFIQNNNNDGGSENIKTPKPSEVPTVPPECKPGCHKSCWLNIFGERECGCVCG